MSDGRWLPIESNPEVINLFLKKLGVPEEYEINDVLGLDEELLGMLPQPVLALLLLFPINDKYIEYVKSQMDSPPDQKVSDKIFYMKQTISNACGTVALLHAIGNNLDTIQLKDGPLKKLLCSTESSSPEDLAKMLEEDDDCCKAHDEAAREGQTAAPSLDDSVEYHYVAFVRCNNDGQLYELDGRKAGPIVVGPCATKEDFLPGAAAACKAYMARDPENINFTILALTGKMQ